MKNEKYILVLNQYNSDNIGDKLLNEMLCKNIERLGYKTINRGFALTTKQEVSYAKDISKFKIKDKIKKYFPEHLKFYVKYKKRLIDVSAMLNVDNCLAVVIGGGQLVKHNSVFMDCMQYWVNWANENNIMSCLYGIGVDTGLTNNEINKYKEILSCCAYVNCRDEESKLILENRIGIKDVKLSPDIAFTLDVPTKKSKEYELIMPYNFETAVAAFGLKKSIEKYYDEILEIIKRNGSPNDIILSATTSSDAIECMRLKLYLKDKGFDSRIKEVVDWDDLIDVMSKSKYVVTGRMHAMIVAKAVGTTFYPLLISDKIRQFCKEYKDTKKLMADIRSLSSNGVCDLIQYIEAQN